MNQNEFIHFMQSVSALSSEQRETLRRELDAPGVAAPSGLTEAERIDQELQQRLVDAGVLDEIRPPIRDLAPYRDRRAVSIAGEPLSETVIRERR